MQSSGFFPNLKYPVASMYIFNPPTHTPHPRPADPVPYLRPCNCLLSPSNPLHLQQAGRQSVKNKPNVSSLVALCDVNWLFFSFGTKTKKRIPPFFFLCFLKLKLTLLPLRLRSDCLCAEERDKYPYLCLVCVCVFTEASVYTGANVCTRREHIYILYIYKYIYILHVCIHKL